MKVNVVKTKCKSKFCYQNQELEVAKRFKYLGFLLTSSFSVKNLLDDLYRRGMKAYFELRHCLGINFRDHVKLSLDLFDALIEPILVYGTES